jgi:hypothetical protein
MVEQLDGLGLVYEKQGNTGAAAYEQSNRVDPFARVTNQLANDLQREQRKIEVEQEKKDKLNFDVLKGLGDIKAWDVDLRAYMYDKVGQQKIKAMQLMTAGKNLSNLADPEVMAFNEELEKTKQEAQLSSKQGTTIDAMKKDLFKNPHKYDVEETTKALKTYEAMTPAERLETPAETLFVPKYNKFALIPKLQGIAMWTKPVGSRGEIEFDEAKAREAMALKLDTEDGEKDYIAGVKKGDWTTPEEMIDVNLAMAKTMFKEKQARLITSSPKEKVDYEYDITNETTTPFYMKKVTNEDTGEKVDAGSLQIRHHTQMGNVNFVLSPKIARDDTGKGIDKTVAVKSGALGITLYNPKSKAYIKEGDTITIDGKTYTKEEALKKGLLIYKTIFTGEGEYDSGGKKIGKTIYFDPDNYTTGATEKSEQSVKDYYMRKKKLEEVARKMNAKYSSGTSTSTTTTTKPTTGTSGGDKPKDPPKKKKALPGS